MASSNRAASIANLQKVLKKHFKPVEAAKRSVFEHLLFACCLENSDHATAEEVFRLLQQQYFDWNEVRVSTTRELSEVVQKLNDPENAATRLKRVLQSVFETLYSFEMESLTKENIGQAAAKLQRFDGSTPFIVAYVTQQGLAGHAIPVNDGLLEAFRIVGIISDAEAANRAVPGLERAIPKSKGVEVGSILHNLGVLFARNPYSPAIRKLLLEIAPDCRERLPKRPVKTPPKKKTPAKKSKKTTASKKKAAAVTKKAPVKKKPTPKKPTTKKTAAKGTKKSATAARKAMTTKKTAAKKSATKQLSKRKPR